MFSKPSDILKAKLRDQIEQFRENPSFLGSDDE